MGFACDDSATRMTRLALTINLVLNGIANMKTLGTITGSAAIVVLAGWAILGDIPSKSSSNVRAQVSDLENPEGKVIPFGKDGIEVLTQGPVHEAFAQPATGRLEVEVTVRKQPPEPIPELPPEQRPEGDNVIWISGYWGWDVDRNDFLWISGFWRAVPPGRAWVPGYWNDDDGSWHWVAGYWSEQSQTSIELLPEPPEPVEEAPPPQEVDDSTYVPGVWVYREQRYWWRPGFWVGHRPGWTWTRAYYVWTPGGYCFVDGYWDYDFHRRGLLYAPVHFHPRYYSQRGWYYRPHYAIETDLLLAALFIRPAWSHYYFGDYYDARYSRLGFTSWLDYRIGGRWNDPAWNYYQWRHRDDPRWAQNLRQTYVTRRQNIGARPPRTFAEQERRALSPTGAQIALVQPVTKLQTLQSSKIKLTTISKTEVQQFRKNAVSVQNFSQQRSKVELQAKGKGVIGPGKAPRTVQLQRPAGLAVPKGEAAPPPPKLPKFGSQTPPKGKGVDQKPSPKKKGGFDDPPEKKKFDPTPKKKGPGGFDNPPEKKKFDPTPKKNGPGGFDDPPAKKKFDPPPKQPDQPPPPKKKAPPPRDDDGRPPPAAKKKPPPDFDDAPPAKKAPPPNSKGKDKKDNAAASNLQPRHPWQDLTVAIVRQSTLGERGAFSPEDPRLIRIPVRRC